MNSLGSKFRAFVCFQFACSLLSRNEWRMLISISVTWCSLRSWDEHVTDPLELAIPAITLTGQASYRWTPAVIVTKRRERQIPRMSVLQNLSNEFSNFRLRKLRKHGNLFVNNVGIDPHFPLMSEVALGLVAFSFHSFHRTHCWNYTMRSCSTNVFFSWRAAINNAMSVIICLSSKQQPSI